MGLFGSGITLGGQMNDLIQSGALNQGSKPSAFSSFMSKNGGALTAAASSSNPMGSLANEGIAMALSAIPFGSTIKGILDKLGLQERINMVSKYGLSSWGASNSPEKSEQEFAQKALPAIMGLIDNIKANPSTLDENLDAIHALITLNIAHHKHRIGKSRAKSSKLGHQRSVDQYQKVLNTLIPEFIDAFRRLGVKITKRPWNISLNQIPDNRYLMHDSRPIDSTYGARFVQFDVDYSGVKVTTDSKGNLKDSSKGGGSMLALGGLAFAAFKMFK